MHGDAVRPGQRLFALYSLDEFIRRRHLGCRTFQENDHRSFGPGDAAAVGVIRPHREQSLGRSASQPRERGRSISRSPTGIIRCEPRASSAPIAHPIVPPMSLLAIPRPAIGVHGIRAFDEHVFGREIRRRILRFHEQAFPFMDRDREDIIRVFGGAPCFPGGDTAGNEVFGFGLFYPGHPNRKEKNPCAKEGSLCLKNIRNMALSDLSLR